MSKSEAKSPRQNLSAQLPQPALMKELAHRSCEKKEEAAGVGLGA